MIRSKKLLLVGALAVGLLGGTAGTARADIIVNNVVDGAPSGGNFFYQYSAQLSGALPGGGGTELDSTGTTGNPGNFFTIYDVRGLIPGSETMPAGWTATEQNVGITPPGTAPTDDPGIVNITFHWTGTEINNLDGPLNLGLFSFLSTNLPAGGLLTFTGATQRDHPGVGDDETDLNNIGFVPGPGPFGPETIPEPGSLALMGLGLGALGMVQWLRRKAV